MSAQVAGLAERRYILPGVIVFGGALIAYFVGVLPVQGEARTKLTDLQGRHTAVQTALQTPGGPVTAGAVKAAQAAREQLRTEYDKCAQLFASADATFEQYFADYQGRRDLPNGTDFRRAYSAAARALAAEAETIAARDANGQRLNPFAFKDWDGAPPSDREIQPAQKEFWIQKACLQTVKRLDGAVLRSVRVGLPEGINGDLSAKLPDLGVTADSNDRWTSWQAFECTVEIEVRSARVAEALAALSALALGGPEQRLISEIRGVQVRSATKMPDAVTVEYDPEQGQKPEDMADIDAMEPGVIVKVTLAVLDPPTAGSAS